MELRPGDRVRLGSPTGKGWRGREGVLMAYDDPRIKAEWPEWSEYVNKGEWWVYLDDAAQEGHHCWRFYGEYYELISKPVTDEELNEVYKSLGVQQP